MSKLTVDGAVSSGKRPASFASVKLPVVLVQQAREAAQPLRRSVAGQIEYWTTLGRVVEHSGLTAQEAQTAIMGYEAAAHNARIAGTLSDIEERFAKADTTGILADRVRDVVLNNRSRDLTTKQVV